MTVNGSKRLNSDDISRYYASALSMAAMTSDAIEETFSTSRDSVHASYYAGSTSRYLPRPPGINPLGTGADYHYRTDRQYFLMVERARADDRDNMMIGQGVSRAVANVVQDGFGLQIETGDTDLDADLMARWRKWAASPDECDYDGERTFEQIVRGLLRNRTVDGDIFVLPTTSGHLQVVENHHCRNPFNQQSKVINGTGIIHGVEVQNRRRVAFHLTPEDMSWHASVSRQTRIRRVPARDRAGNRQVFQIYDPRRFSQHRGVTAFAPIVFPTRYHDDLQFATLVNAKRSSFIAIIRQHRDIDTPSPGRDRQGGSRTDVTRDDGTTRTEEGGQPGQVIRGNPGEEIKAWTPNIPAPSFFEHSTMLLSIISVNLDLPPMIFTLDASKTNFNGYRGVIDQARLRFTQIQTDLIAQFHVPCYRWFVRRLLASDPAIRAIASRSDIDLFAHRWTPRGWPYIQPVQDAAADDLRLTKNLISGRRRAQERGIDFDDLTTEIIEDRALLVEKAIVRAAELNSQYQDADVEWRELAYGGDAQVSLSLTGSLDDNEPASQQGQSGGEKKK